VHNLLSIDRGHDVSSTTHNRQPPSSQSPRLRSRELAQYFAWVRQIMLSMMWNTMWRGTNALFPILRVQLLATTRTMASTLGARRSTCLMYSKDLTSSFTLIYSSIDRAHSLVVSHLGKSSQPRSYSHLVRRHSCAIRHPAPLPSPKSPRGSGPIHPYLHCFV
jgi:hypothetical protein